MRSSSRESARLRSMMPAWESFQAAELHHCVARIEGYGSQRDGKARQQTDGGGSGLGHSALTKERLARLSQLFEKRYPIV